MSCRMVYKPVGVMKRNLNKAISIVLAPDSQASKKVKDIAWRLHHAITTTSNYEDPKLRLALKDAANTLSSELGTYAADIITDYRALPSKQKKKTSEYMYVLSCLLKKKGEVLG